MITASPEDKDGNRIVSQTRPEHGEVQIGEFNWDCGVPVFYAYPHFPFTQATLDAIQSMMGWLKAPEVKSDAELNHDYIVKKMQPMYDAFGVQAPTWKQP